MKTRLPSRAFLMVLVAAVALPVIWTNWRARNVPVEKPEPFQFPTAELAALDRDLQRRFAVVPTRDFGMARIGNLHALYVPENWAEKQTIRNLDKSNLKVAFYVMNRRTWRNEWGEVGQYPIQGPVYITAGVKAPLPRRNPASNFTRIKQRTWFKVETRFEEPAKTSMNDERGREVAATPIPEGLPEGRTLRELGDKVFEDAAVKAVDFRVGNTVDAGDWRVAAVPVRASSTACLRCHNYGPYGAKLDKKLTVGDALGVAMYAYKRAVK